MKAKEIRELNLEEIQERLREEREQLDSLRFQHGIADLPNPMLLRQKRRLIARLETLQKEKEQA